MLHQLVSVAVLLRCMVVVVVVRVRVVAPVVGGGETGGGRSWDEAGGGHGEKRVGGKGKRGMRRRSSAGRFDCRFDSARYTVTYKLSTKKQSLLHLASHRAGDEVKRGLQSSFASGSSQPRDATCRTIKEQDRNWKASRSRERRNEADERGAKAVPRRYIRCKGVKRWRYRWVLASSSRCKERTCTRASVTHPGARRKNARIRHQPLVLDPVISILPRAPALRISSRLEPNSEKMHLALSRTFR